LNLISGGWKITCDGEEFSDEDNAFIIQKQTADITRAKKTKFYICLGRQRSNFKESNLIFFVAHKAKMSHSRVENFYLLIVSFIIYIFFNVYIFLTYNVKD